MGRNGAAFIRLLVLVAIGIAIDLLGLSIARATGAKLFLDTIGTIGVAAFGGIAPGIIVGLLATVVGTLSNQTQIYFMSVNILVAVIAALGARRGAFTRVGRTLLLGVILAAVCSVVGSVLSWAITGMNLGEGVPSQYVREIAASTGWSTFLSELAGDSATEFPDKILSCAIVFLMLRWLPGSVTKRFPYGGLHIYRSNLVGAKGEAGIRQPGEAFHRTYSLATKATFITAGTAIALGCACLIVSFGIYADTTNKHYETLGRDVCDFAITQMDADAIGTYLDRGSDAPGYTETEDALIQLDQNMDSVAYIYVYRIEQDGCHVVFDSDPNTATRGRVGQVVAIDPGFESSMPALLAGEQIDPIVTDAEYGWLLTVYEPLYDSSGACSAYVCADISMGDVLADRVAFISKVASIVFAATILIIVFSSARVRRSIVDPINQLSSASRHIAFDRPEERSADIDQLRSIDIESGDEVENLYKSVVKLTDDAAGYIEEIGESNRQIAHQVTVIRRLQENTITSFAELTDARDRLTGGHIRRTAKYMDMLANACLEHGLYPDELTEDFVRECIRSAPLHDIGKIEISDTLLNKPGRFTDEEYEEMKTHAAKGGRILKSVLTGIDDEDTGYLDTAVEMATYHHERWDGKGYPEGLSGTDIPLCARLMAVVDVFDALYTKRPYKEGLSFNECIVIMENESGKAFDPALLAAFIGIRDQINRVADALARHDRELEDIAPSSAQQMDATHES